MKWWFCIIENVVRYLRKLLVEIWWRGILRRLDSLSHLKGLRHGDG